MPAPTYPPELLHTIFYWLADDRQSLLVCALVCQLWLPGSRYYILCNDKYTLQQDQLQIPIFLALFAKPNSSLSMMHIEKLSLRQNTITDTEAMREGRLTGDEWRQESAIHDFFQSKVIDSFPCITSLDIQWVYIGAVPHAAWPSLKPSHQAITSLLLSWTAFDSVDKLQQLLCSFPSLERLELGDGIIFTSPIKDFTSIKWAEPHPKLRMLTLNPVGTQFLRFIASSMEYLPGISFLDITFDGYGYPAEFQVCSSITQTAGEHLQGIKLHASNGFKGRAFPDDAFATACLDLIQMRHNLNLRHVDLDLGDESLIVPFVQRLAHPEALEHLTFAIHTVGTRTTLEVHKLHIDWPAFEQCLSKKQYPNLTEVTFAISETQNQFYRCTSEQRATGKRNAIEGIKQRMPIAARRLIFNYL